MQANTAALTDDQKYSEEESRNKNVEEYNATATKYDAWCKTNSLMQNYCYYSTFAEIEKVSGFFKKYGVSRIQGVGT